VFILCDFVDRIALVARKSALCLCAESCSRVNQNEPALVLLKADSLQRRLDFRIRHKHLPDQSRPVVLDHDHDQGLVQTHIDIFKPVLGEVKTIAESVDTPQFAALSHDESAWALYP
jgi:hypothetical protein